MGKTRRENVTTKTLFYNATLINFLTAIKLLNIVFGMLKQKTPDYFINKRICVE